TVVLAHPRNATIAGGSATGTITNDDPPPAKPGLYYDQPGGLGLGLWVFEDGLTVGRFSINFVAECQPSESFLINLSFPGAAVLIGPDRTFTFDNARDTSSVGIRGAFDTSGTSASGSYHAHVVFTYEGTQYECDSGQQIWAARWKMPLPP